MAVDEAQRNAARKDGNTFDHTRRYPIRNKSDLANAIRAVGHTKASERDAVRRYIIREAKRLNAPYPKTWNADGSLKPASK